MGDLKSIGLDPPAHTIALTLPGQSQREVILIGNPEKAEPLTPVLRQGESTVYMVQTGDLAKLMPPGLSPYALRDKTIERLAPADIRSIEIAGRGAEEAVTLRHEGVNWRVLKDGKVMEADATKISGLLDAFDPLTAAKWLPQAGAPATQAPVEVTVRITYSMPPAATTVPATGPARPPATSPATAPATTRAGATAASAPAATAPLVSGPAQAGPTVTKILTLSKNKDNTWTASYAPMAGPSWVFEPTAGLVEQLTATHYAAPAATAPATTQAATTAPATP